MFASLWAQRCEENLAPWLAKVPPLELPELLRLVSFCHRYCIPKRSCFFRLDWAYFCWNWKHCSEVIFKYVNSTVGPIFNEKVAEKWNLWDLWIVHPCTVHSWLGQIARLEPKKKKEKKEEKTQGKTQTWDSAQSKCSPCLLLQRHTQLFYSSCVYGHQSWWVTANPYCPLSCYWDVGLQIWKWDFAKSFLVPAYRRFWKVSIS